MEEVKAEVLEEGRARVVVLLLKGGGEGGGRGAGVQGVRCGGGESRWEKEDAVGGSGTGLESIAVVVEEIPGWRVTVKRVEEAKEEEEEEVA